MDTDVDGIYNGKDVRIGILDSDVSYGIETCHKFQIDTTPPKIETIRILKGKKKIGEKTSTIEDAYEVYSKDYNISKIISTPVVEGETFLEITFDEPLDKNVPLDIFFTSDKHPISFLSYGDTDAIWYGEFYIPHSQEYHGTHTLSIEGACDLAGNIFDADPDTEGNQADTSNQFYIIIPDLAFTQVKDGQYNIHLLNIEKGESVIISPGSEPQFFPDGQWLACHGGGTGTDIEIWRMSLDGGSITNLTNDTRSDEDFIISPDGKRIFFNRERKLGPYSVHDIWRLDLDGGTQTNLTDTDKMAEFIKDISEDQTKLLYYSWEANGGTWSIYTMDTDGSNKTKVIDERDGCNWLCNEIFFIWEYNLQSFI